MEASRMGIEKKPNIVPRLRLDNETFSFVKKLKVGDKGDMKFAAIVKAHRSDEEDDDLKTIKFTNLELSSNRSARLA